MADVRVGCINKVDRFSSHEHITHLGNALAPWRWTREQVIASIEAGTNTFYVLSAGGKRADVGVVRVPGAAPYLRTHADGVWTDDLLSLPECPII